MLNVAMPRTSDSCTGKRRGPVLGRGLFPQLTTMSMVIWLASGCTAGNLPARIAAGPAPDVPTAAESTGELQRLLLAVAEYRTCKGQVGRLVGISSLDAPGAPIQTRPMIPLTGRLWVERCSAQRNGESIRLALAGRGWTSVHVVREVTAGATFGIDGLLVFGLSTEFSAPVRVATSRSTLSVWLTAPTVTNFGVGVLRQPSVTPINVRGAFGRAALSIIGDYEATVASKIQEETSGRVQEAIRSGFTATVNVCTSQPDSIAGTLPAGLRPQRPYLDDGSRWLANELVQLDADGIDFAGPFDGRGGPLRAEVELSRGSAIGARFVCVDEVRGAIDGWLHGSVSAQMLRASFGLPAQRGGVTQDFDGHCLAVLVTAPVAPETVIYRMRVTAAADRAEPILPCDSMRAY